MDQPDSVSGSNSEQPNPQTKEMTLVQPLPHRLQSGSPAVSGIVEVPSRKRKRSSRPSSAKPEPDPPSQPPVDDRADEQISRISQSSKRWKIDCVLITTLPPVPHKKPTLPESFEDEGNRSRTKTKMRGRQKPRGKRREATPTSRTPVSVSMRSRSHSVSSLRPPLFDPVSAGLS